MKWWRVRDDSVLTLCGSGAAVLAAGCLVLSCVDDSNRDLSDALIRANRRLNSTQAMQTAVYRQTVAAQSLTTATEPLQSAIAQASLQDASYSLHQAWNSLREANEPSSRAPSLSSMAAQLRRIDGLCRPGDFNSARSVPGSEHEKWAPACVSALTALAQAASRYASENELATAGLIAQAYTDVQKQRSILLATWLIAVALAVVAWVLLDRLTSRSSAACASVADVPARQE